MARIAFFDVDLTLISVNSARLWLRRELRGGYIGRWDLVRGLFWIGLYTFGLARMERVLEDAVRALAGSRERDLEERTRAFYVEEIRALLRPGALAAIEAHRARGDRLFLLTTSSTYMSKLLVAELGFDGFVSNHFAVADGVLTGDIVPPLCFGAGKVTRAQALAGELGASLEDCVFYTDSFSDVPMLEAVGTPVVINPDPRLRRHAERRRWPIHDWGTAA